MYISTNTGNKVIPGAPARQTMNVVMTVLANMHLSSMILSYQAGLTKEMSTMFQQYRKRMKLSVYNYKCTLSNPAMVRTHILFKLLHKGKLDVAKKLLRQCLGSFILPTSRPNASFMSAMDNAARFRDLEILKYLHENELGTCTKAAMDIAAANGDLDIVQYLDKNRSEGCSLAAFIAAKENGHTQVFNYLQTHRRTDRSCLPPADPKAVILPLLGPLLVGVAATATCTIQ